MRKAEIAALVGFLLIWGTCAIQPGFALAQAEEDPGEETSEEAGEETSEEPGEETSEEPGAQPNEEELRNAEARALFAEGVTEVNAGRWDEAIRLFRQAYELRAAPAIAWNLGTSLINAGRLAEGSEWVQRVLADETTAPDMRENAEALIADVEPRLAHVSIELVGPSEGVEVTLDEHALPDISLPVPADPGAHTLAAARDGQVVDSERFELDEGGAERITLEIPALILQGGGSSGSIIEEWWFWTAVGGGAVVLGVLIAIGIAVGGQGTSDPVQGTTNPPILVFP